MASTRESYAVAAELVLKSNVAEALRPVIEAMENIDKALKGTSEGFAGLAKAAAKAAADMVKSQNEATESAVKGAKAQQEAAERAGRASARAYQQAGEAASKAARQAEQSARRGGHLSAMDVSIAAGTAAGGLGSLITSAGRAALDPAYTLSMLRTDHPGPGHEGVSDAAAKNADEAAWAATRSAPGTTYSKNLEAVVDLKNVTGSLSDAVKILPQFANLSAILAVADRASGGSGDQAFAAAKAMEVLGQLTEERKNAQTGRMEQYIDPAQLPARLERMAKVAVGTMGRVNPQDYLAFAKTARAGGMTLSDEFLYEKLPAMMMVMGASRAGTAIQSMSQVFQGGRLTNKSWSEMKELGLGGDSHEVTTGTGKNKRTEIKGSIYEQNLLMSDPAAWAAKVHDHLVNDLHMTDAQAMNSVQKFAQRSTIAGMLADLMKDGAGIIKEQGNIQHTDVSGVTTNNPEAKINQLHASFENLLAALGGPMIEPAVHVMDAVTAKLNMLGDWARANPGEAEVIGKVATGLFGLATRSLPSARRS